MQNKESPFYRKSVFVSGHIDLTEAEFDEHYKPLIDDAIENAFCIVVGDAPGCDIMAQRYVESKGKGGMLKIFHMFNAPRNIVGSAGEVFPGFESDNQRDSAMTSYSDVDIAWVRPGREKSGTQKNLDRRK